MLQRVHLLCLFRCHLFFFRFLLEQFNVPDTIISPFLEICPGPTLVLIMNPVQYCLSSKFQPSLWIFTRFTLWCKLFVLLMSDEIVKQIHEHERISRSEERRVGKEGR